MVVFSKGFRVCCEEVWVFGWGSEEKIEEGLFEFDVGFFDSFSSSSWSSKLLEVRVFETGFLLVCCCCFGCGIEEKRGEDLG